MIQDDPYREIELLRNELAFMRWRAEAWREWWLRAEDELERLRMPHDKD